MVSVELNADLLARYSSLMQTVAESTNAVQLTYVWVDGCQGLRSKVKTVYSVPKNISDVSIWAYAVDWFYSSELALGAEVKMIPVRMYNDPILGGNNKLVLVETVTFDEGKPVGYNTRRLCAETLENALEQKPEFGIEQEYYLFKGDDRWQPLGWPKEGYPPENGPFNCGVGANNAYGRDLAEAHFRACLAAGISITGESAGTKLSQWKFTIGPKDALTVCDDLWMARYILHRLSEQFNVVVSFDSKLFPKQIGDGTSVTFTLKSMRASGGSAAVKNAIAKLEKTHSSHVKSLQFGGYPSDLVKRLVKDEVEIKFDVAAIEKDNGSVLLRDKQPPSNLDPYVVCQLLAQTIC